MLIGIIIVVVILIFAALRSSPTYDLKPNKEANFETKVPVDAILKIIIKYAQLHNYKIDDLDEEKSRLILSDSASLTSFGFLYPINITKSDSGVNLVEIGVASKTIQTYGPVITNKHKQLVNGIKAALIVES